MADHPLSLPLRELPGFDGLYGLEILHVDEGEVRAQVPVARTTSSPAGSSTAACSPPWPSR